MAETIELCKGVRATVDVFEGRTEIYLEEQAEDGTWWMVSFDLKIEEGRERETAEALRRLADVVGRAK